MNYETWKNVKSYLKANSATVGTIIQCTMYTQKENSSKNVIYLYAKLFVIIFYGNF